MAAKSLGGADNEFATTANFLGENLYGDINTIFLQKEAADKLIVAQSLLSNFDSTLSLIVFDAVRPLSVQQKMWDKVKETILYVRSKGYRVDAIGWQAHLLLGAKRKDFVKNIENI